MESKYQILKENLNTEKHMEIFLNSLDELTEISKSDRVIFLWVIVEIIGRKVHYNSKKNNEITVIEVPPYSTDLNPI